VPAADLLLVLIRWLHGLAAVAWIGAILYELIVIPGDLLTKLDVATRERMRLARAEVTQASLVAFLTTGAVLTFDRLSRAGADGAYVGVLALKVALSVAMFQIAFRSRAAGGAERTVALRWLAILGVLILLLAALLKTLFERTLVP